MSVRFGGRVWSLVSFGLAVAGLVGFLAFREQRLQRPAELGLTSAGQVDMCLTCHREVRLDAAHDPGVLGCAVCHLGDPMTVRKEQAHSGMVRNPGDLRVVERTCGVEGCHRGDAHTVKRSLMATNRGILSTLLYYWGETESQDSDYTVERLLESGESSLALDYFRKLCATCHLWKRRDDLEGAPAFFRKKGGGCTACHLRAPAGRTRLTVLDFDEEGRELQPTGGLPPHPLLTRKVDEHHCIRCHNRSGRIGLSYIGVFEAEGYGAPYEQGGPSPQRLPGGRFYLRLAEDVHHRRGMACIDCHTRKEVMGDGVSHVHYEEQLETACASCHGPRPGVTRKGNRLDHVRPAPDSGGWVLEGKLDGRLHPLRPPKAGVCDGPLHRRLSCDACHAAWVPQCYGCHAKRDARQTHLDKLTLKQTPGWWEEGRSYIRYERPMLGVWGDEVVVVTPGCQDVVTLIDEQGAVSGFNRFTMAAISPHTIQPRGRACGECHADPKTIGLGEGAVRFEGGRWTFRPLDRGVDSLEGDTVGLDRFVTIDGEPLQHGARQDLRPFNREEIARILRVGLCLPCHDRMDDPAYRDYTPATRCPVFDETGLAPGAGQGAAEAAGAGFSVAKVRGKE